jgi:hypothetical protein
MACLPKPDSPICADLNLGDESDRFSQEKLEILQEIDGARRLRIGENTFRRGKPVGESETLVLGELNLPKNSNIPWRNQGITKGESWVAFKVKLEERVVKKE